MKYGLTAKELADIVNVFRHEPKIEKAILFGSRAKGNYRPGSDIDIAVDGKEISFDDFLKLKSRLDELDILQKIELLELSKIKTPDLIGHIKRVGIILYQKGS